MTTEIRWLRVQTYCAKYDCSARSVYDWVKQGRLPSIKLGTSLKVADALPTERRKVPREPEADIEEESA